ncbi:MAG: metal-sulfur cluster assembly factor [Lactobacillus sp.]|nr:metal-sulfur cluster assembly factor [Lactobacillus sp.]
MTKRSKAIIKQEILTNLGQVIDPELMINVVDLGLIYDLDLDEDGICLVTMSLTRVGCPLVSELSEGIKAALLKVAEIKYVDINLVWYPRWTPDRISEAGKKQLGM